MFDFYINYYEIFQFEKQYSPTKTIYHNMFMFHNILSYGFQNFSFNQSNENRWNHRSQDLQGAKTFPKTDSKVSTKALGAQMR